MRNLMEEMESVMTRWTVDECPDARGFWTIRRADGTPNGNTEAPPIATVYGLALAETIVADHNDRLAKRNATRH